MRISDWSSDVCSSDLAFVHAILPGDDPEKWSVVTTVADAANLSAWCLAKLGQILPEGRYRLEGQQPGKALFGWMSAQYRFDPYKSNAPAKGSRKSEEHTSELQSLIRISYAVLCLKKKRNLKTNTR